MEKNRLDEIVKKNPKVDRVAVDRSQQAAKQLADVGIKLGGYRLEPALGGGAIKSSEQAPRGSSAA
ncbi:MAG: hypothetical protein OXH86_06895 [Acidimicrobiaceae bacterium]|nr:hypothetical protein [Acidimicrobiaceae bacterium]